VADASELEKLMKDVRKSLQENSTGIKDLQATVSTIADRVSALERETRSVNRKVDAIETLPQAFGRPKVFHTATEFHSVSHPVRRKQGYQG
jgi:prophage DNA circulation protein